MALSDQYLRAARAVHAFTARGAEVGDTLTTIAELSSEALGADMAGMTLHDQQGNVSTAVFTERMVPEIDQAQYDSDRGPCLQAFRDLAPYLMSDASSEDRWPEYAREARRHGIHSSLSVPIVLGDRSLGALNLYSAEAGHFEESDIGTTELFAGLSAAAAAFAETANLADQLSRALLTRATIEQAKGIIMANVGCDPDTAFDLLRQQSQAENRKLNTIAAELVAQQQRRPDRS